MIRCAPLCLTTTLVLSGVALSASQPPFVRPEGWGAYFRDPEKGIESPLTLPLEKIPGRQWLGLRWTDFKGPRLRIAVMPVDDKAPLLAGQPGTGAAAVASAVGVPLQVVPVNAVEDLLGGCLQATHRFRLFERKALEGIMAEKQIQASMLAAQAASLHSPGAPTSANPIEAQKQLVEAAAKAPLTEAANKALQQKASATLAAKLMGANYLIYASITEWTPDRKKKDLSGGGLAPGVLGHLGVKGTTAEVAMSFRVVDATTGEIKHQIDERATAENWGLSLFFINVGGGGAAGAGGGLDEKSPINYAVRACINKAVYRIGMALKNQPWRGSVIKFAEDGRVYINSGREDGMEPGMTLDALALGDLLKDPVTGEVLDAETKPAGKITLSEVRDRVSLGSITPSTPAVPLRPGDRVEFASRL
ncbi:MAG TPA: CsgG/HfaB family protein [Geothrix sp.]|nr:CsgG/HfaB family protein [Geothrix sp.]